MKIKKLDNFGEGFTVTPRKPHSSAETSCLPLTHKERSMRVVDVVRSRLEQHGVCHGSVFSEKSRRHALNYMRSIHVSGLMDLERIGTARHCEGYKVAGNKKPLRK